MADFSQVNEWRSVIYNLHYIFKSKLNTSLSANQIENCYTAGKLNGNQMLGAGFAFVDGDSVPSDAIKNVLCEKGMAEKTVAEGSADGAKFVSEETLKNGAEQLGEAFKND